MNETFAAVLALENAKLTRQVDTPEEPFGYGAELSCISDLTPDLREVDPFSLEGIAEAVLRRWDTPRGTNLDDLDYGESIAGMLNAPTTFQTLRAKEGRLRAEAEKDDRVEDCVVRLTMTDNGTSMRISATITPVDPDLAAFELIAALVDAKLLLEEIKRV